MTRNVLCVRPDLSLDAVAVVFLEQGFAALPVTSDEGQLLGVVAEADVTLRVQLGGDGAACVRDVMQPVHCALLESVPASQAAGILVCEGVERLVVVQPDGCVVGVLSSADLLAWIARSDGYTLPGVSS